ncbi:MAG TPA: hypothetical protein VIP56_08375, partial [Nitrososphaeraceae archaeon]
VTKWLIIITCLTAITDLLKYFKAKYLLDCLGVSSAAVVAAEIVLLSHHFLFYLLHFPVYKKFPENLALVIKPKANHSMISPIFTDSFIHLRRLILLNIISRSLALFIDDYDYHIRRHLSEGVLVYSSAHACFDGNLQQPL